MARSLQTTARAPNLKSARREVPLPRTSLHSLDAIGQRTDRLNAVCKDESKIFRNLIQFVKARRLEDDAARSRLLMASRLLRAR
jgi:hypothetical protein